MVFVVVEVEFKSEVWLRLAGKRDSDGSCESWNISLLVALGELAGEMGRDAVDTSVTKEVTEMRESMAKGVGKFSCLKK